MACSGVEYQESWNFKGLAKMAQFGYELGLEAAARPSLVEWQPGDEFETARKKGQNRIADDSTLFTGSGLKPAHYEALHYPPLARQVRISGRAVSETDRRP